MEFNGSRKDALKIIAEDFGGDHLAFNKKYTKITIGGRPADGIRSQGAGRPLKINYTDTVKKYTGSRKEYIELSTPDPEVRKAGAKVFQNNTGESTDVDHGNRVERTGKALKPMTPDRRATYHSNMEKAGVFIGDDPRNLAPEDPSFNRGQDFKQHHTMDKGIKAARINGKQSTTLTQIDQTGTTSKSGRQQAALAAKKLPGLPATRAPYDLRGVMPWMDYVGPIDQMTGGHVESTIDKGVNVLRQSLGIAPNPVGHHPTPDPLLSIRNTVARGIWDMGRKMFGNNHPYPEDIK